MLSEPVLGGEALGAQGAVVGEGAAVLGHPVVPQCGLLGERGPTRVALERTLPRVRADVRGQLESDAKALAADLAGERLSMFGSVLMRRHLVCRQAALKLETEEALITAELPLPTIPPFPHFRPAFLRGTLEHRCAVRQCLCVFPLVLGQLLPGAKGVQAHLAAHFGGAVGVRLDVVFEHGLAAKQALARGAHVTLAVPVHADVFRVHPGADEDAGAVRALLLAHRAVLHPLVAPELPPVEELARALAALEPAAVVQAHVPHQAAPVERGVVALGAALPQWLQHRLFFVGEFMHV